MDIAFGMALYFMTWWLTLFAVLPFGVITQEENKNVVPGTPASAPHVFKWKKVFLINTLVALLGFLGILYALKNNLLGTAMPLEEISKILN